MINTHDLQEELEWLEKQMDQTIRELEKLKKKVPESYRLRVAKHRDSYQYFLRTRGKEKNGTYLNKKNRDKAVNIAQMEYDKALIPVLQEAIEDLKRCMELLDNPFLHAEEQLNPGKRALIQIPYETDESFIARWMKQEYEPMGFNEEGPIYVTRNGLRVRSKTEILIAEMLDEFQIPFLYEKPLQLNTGLVRPDFTLLNLRERSEVYWEHFGMMDDPEYLAHALRKLRSYENSGFYQPDSVVWTFETGFYPINTVDLRGMIIKLKDRLGYY